MPGRFKCVFILAVCCFQLQLAHGQVVQHGSWEQSLTSDDRSNLLDEIVFKYTYAPEDAKDSVVLDLQERSKNASEDLTAWNLLLLAEFAQGRSDFLSSIELLDSASSFTEDSFLLAKIQLRMGQTYTLMNSLDKAWIAFNSASAIARKMHHHILCAKIYASLGEFNRKTYAFDRGLLYLDSAQTLINKHHIFDRVNITVYDRKAAIYSQKAMLDSVKRYSDKALALAYEQEDKHAQAISHNEMGYYFEHLPNFDSAFYHYDRAISIWTELNSIRYLVNAQFNKGRLLMKDKRDKEAKVLLHETERNCANRGWLEVYPSLYEHIEMVYLNEGDSINYYKYLAKTTQAYYDLDMQANDRKLTELQFELDKQKSLQIIEQQKALLEINEENLALIEQKRNQLLLFLLIVSVLLIISVVLTIRVYKNRRPL